MKKYVSIELVNLGVSLDTNFGIIYEHTYGEPAVTRRVTYTDGMRELAKLARTLHKAPIMTINPYDKAIFYRSLAGVVTE